MRMLSLFLALIFTTMTIDSSFAQSRMISTSAIVEGVSLRQEREKVITFIQGEEIQKQMIKMGIDPTEAVQRVASLSQKEIQLLSSEIDKAPAGGDFGVGSIVGAAVFVFIVLLITDILGFTKIFPFTRSVR